MSKKTFRYRLYPTGAQRDVLDGQLRLCCELYNAAFRERRDAWCMARVSIGFAGTPRSGPNVGEYAVRVLRSSRL
jgi:transposase